MQNMSHENQATDRTSLREKVCIIDCSKRCEPSGYLLNKVFYFLKNNSYAFSESPEESGFLLINTCCVTEGKKEQSLGEITRLLKRISDSEPNKSIIVFGCVAEAEKEEVLSRCSGLLRGNRIYFVGPKELDKIEEIFPHKSGIDERSAGKMNERLFTSYQDKIDLSDYYIMISQGCTNRCAYCNIKNAKGNVQSRRPDDILEDIRLGLDRGFTTFVLLADDCASYGKDFVKSSGSVTNIEPDLISLMSSILDIDDRIILKTSSLYPGFLLSNEERFIKVMSSGRISYLNIPLESGSQRILDKMNRRYNKKKILEVIARMREASPDTWIYTHILIGFPGETRHDFVESMDVMKYFDEVMVIAYSDNKNTPAAKQFPKVSADEISERIRMSNLTMGLRRINGLVVGNDQTYTHGITKSREIAGSVQPGSADHGQEVRK